MVAKRKRKRADEPPLDDDTNWLKLPKALQILSELLKEDNPFFYPRGKQLLFEALRNEELDCMRESRTNPIKRERVHAPFWPRLGTLHKALSSSTSISGKGPRGIFGWDYYVWKPHFDQLRSRIEQNVQAHGEPTGPVPSPWLSQPQQSSSVESKPTDSALDAARRSGAITSTIAAGASSLPKPMQPEQPQAEQLPHIRRRRGGKPPLLTPEEITAGKEYCNQQLDANPDWILSMGGKQNACGDIIVNKIPRLRGRAQECWQTIKRNILDPVLEERKNQMIS